ncbi:MAG TPA: hypothetical protein VFD82_02870 [Planctomycetota bacterium]|nr:hypothetical protein [Planctomycetota bacterium]
MKTILRACFVLVLLLVATLLPFAPGRHDVLALALSTVAQGLGYAGLLLVPFGVLWFVHGLRNRQDRTAADRIRRRYALITIGLATLLGLAGAVVGAAQAGYSLGVALAAAVLVTARNAVTRSLVRTQMDIGPDSLTPLCWLIAPPLLLFAQWKIAPEATAYARDRAIANAAPLIADIERYRASHARYPLTLHSLWEDYGTSVIGIPRYLYEPQGDSYNLFFEAPAFEFGARVIVVWNPRDEQVATSHNRDLLEFTGADLEQRRGYITAHAAAQPHWKWFVFD